MSKEKVLLGISGGVDSATTAKILKDSGYDVTAAMMKTYAGENIASSCYGSTKEQEIKDAKAICDKLGIEFHLIDCTKPFYELVFEKFQNQYNKGFTPNPCVMCNSKVKFGAFWDLARSKGIEFDKFATGHYARVENEKGRYVLKKARSEKRDQSYFLYRLTQAQLSKIIFPLGDKDKEDVRKYAKEQGLIVHDKKDSQDFYNGKLSDILNLNEKNGEIVTTKGEILGYHTGIHNFTIGQRKGIKIAYSEPLYVIELDAYNNKVIVGTKEETFSRTLVAGDLNWIAFDELNGPIEAFCKHRSVQNPHKCVIEPIGDNKIKVTFEEDQSSITKGQSAVIYDGDTVLGGGRNE
jgi:tRNA-specific 2-thiouridylase